MASITNTNLSATSLLKLVEHSDSQINQKVYQCIEENNVNGLEKCLESCNLSEDFLKKALDLSLENQNFLCTSALLQYHEFSQESLYNAALLAISKGYSKALEAVLDEYLLIVQNECGERVGTLIENIYGSQFSEIAPSFSDDEKENLVAQRDEDLRFQATCKLIERLTPSLELLNSILSKACARKDLKMANFILSYAKNQNLKLSSFTTLSETAIENCEDLATLLIENIESFHNRDIYLTQLYVKAIKKNLDILAEKIRSNMYLIPRLEARLLALEIRVLGPNSVT